MKCKDCRYVGRCLYENVEFAGIKTSDCCEVKQMNKRRHSQAKHKHQWRKVAATYSKDVGLKTTKKKCIICGTTKPISMDAQTLR